MHSSHLLDDERIAALAQAAATGATYADVAYASGVHPSTLANWRAFGDMVISGAGEDGDVSAVAEELGIDTTFAERTRSLVMTIERERAESRLDILRSIAAHGDDVHDGDAVPALRGSLSALTWRLTHTAEGYAERKPPASPLVHVGDVHNAVVSVDTLQRRYDALDDANAVDAPRGAIGASTATRDDALMLVAGEVVEHGGGGDDGDDGDGGGDVEHAAGDAAEGVREAAQQNACTGGVGANTRSGGGRLGRGDSTGDENPPE